MTEILEDCQLEWDRLRGVLYVHSGTTGGSVLRICGLPIPNSDAPPLDSYGRMIDVTLKFKTPTVTLP